MKVKILGGGCTKCKTLAERTEEAAKDLGLDYELEKITDMNRYVEFGVAVTPALVVDGDVKSVGKVPSVDEIKKLIG